MIHSFSLQNGHFTGYASSESLARGLQKQGIIQQPLLQRLLKMSATP